MTYADVIQGVTPKNLDWLIDKKVKDLTPGAQQTVKEQVSDLSHLSIDEQTKNSFKIETLQDVPIALLPSSLQKDVVWESNLMKLEQEYERVKKKSPGAWVGYQIGNMYYQKGGESNFGKAKKYYEEVLELHPNHKLANKISEDLKLIEKSEKAFQDNPQLVREDVVREKTGNLTILTSQGEMKIELYLKETPEIHKELIKKIQEGFYNGLNFYKVDQKRMYTGCPMGNGKSNKVISNNHEYQDNWLKKGHLVVEPGKEKTEVSSKFFFVRSQEDSGDYLVIGKVVEGLDVLDKITPKDVVLDTRVDEAPSS
jgi:cyclophilin family peptidyl-prolyl cis-trans isomerase